MINFFFLLIYKNVHVCNNTLETGIKRGCHGRDHLVVGFITTFVPMQSVPISTKVVSSPGTPVSSTYKTDCHDINEILLKVALNTITITPGIKISVSKATYMYIYIHFALYAACPFTLCRGFLPPK